MSARDLDDQPANTVATDDDQHNFWTLGLDEAPRVPSGPDFDTAQFAYAEHVRRPTEDDDCASTACKALAELGYTGLTDDVAEIIAASERIDTPEEAWRKQLEWEGKHDPAGTSIGDLVGQRPHPEGGAADD